MDHVINMSQWYAVIEKKKNPTKHLFEDMQMECHKHVTEGHYYALS